MSITKNEKHEFISKKQFGIYLGIGNRAGIKKRYEMYLFIAGKKPVLKLTTKDILDIDGIKM